MLRPLWNMVGARWSHLERLTSGDRSSIAVAGGPGKWRGPAERPRDSLFSLTATSDLHGQGEAPKLEA